MMEESVRALAGMAGFIALCWLISEARRQFPWRAVLVGLSVQVGLALLLTQVPAVTAFFAGIAHVVDAVQSATQAGTMFMFGYLGGGEQPFRVEPGASTFIFALQALPAILLVGALAALLWHWRILIWVVRGAAWLFGRVFGVSGPVGVSTSACIFLGMVEAPMLVRPYLSRLSRGELFIIMVDGLSVIGGSMMILLGTLLESKVPNAFSHLLIGSLIATPMAITLARVIIPATGDGPPPEPMALDTHYRSSLEALTMGTLQAVKMAVNITALLIVFVSLIALVNKGLALLSPGDVPLTLSLILGKLLAPVAWAMGVPLADVEPAAALLGTKLITNEVVAYSDMMALPPDALQPKTVLMMTYALCSFGNIGSVAILIGTLSSMAPDKVGEVVQLGFKALLAAFLTTCMTGALMGLLLG
ncbi:NupC/NupG family nucleoside CNT transporter [Niveispirillum fermenti]|uniref:NupC/NupG family nucleoside CNT transporter n=1 Tax=Niveispirillum fermenti TaxID=1233113 RepID=UPI003A838DA2